MLALGPFFATQSIIRFLSLPRIKSPFLALILDSAHFIRCTVALSKWLMKNSDSSALSQTRQQLSANHHLLISFSLRRQAKSREWNEEAVRARLHHRRTRRAIKTLDGQSKQKSKPRPETCDWCDFTSLKLHIVHTIYLCSLMNWLC